MNPKRRFALCTNRRLTERHPSCGGRGAERLADRLEQYLQEQAVAIPLERSGCLGRCEHGPNLRIAPEGVFITLRDEQDFPLVLDWLAQHP